MFSVQNEADAEQKLARLGEEIHSMGVERFMDRYRIPTEFIDATVPLPRKRHPSRPLL